MDDEVRKQIFEDFKKMITTESVVGQPIYLGDATIVPLWRFPSASAPAVRARML